MWRIWFQAEAIMIPYRVSVLAPNTHDRRSYEIKLYGTYAENDDEALRTVSEVMPDGWQVDRIAGLLSRVEVEHLDLAYGEVRQVSACVIDGLILPEDALSVGHGGEPSPLG